MQMWKMKLLIKLICYSEDEANLIANHARKQARSAVEQMENICVAPGEKGEFQNWNKDLFLEEKCFPEKFPYENSCSPHKSIQHVFDE